MKTEEKKDYNKIAYFLIIAIVVVTSVLLISKKSQQENNQRIFIDATFVGELAKGQLIQFEQS